MNLNPTNQNQKFPVQELAAATNLQPQSVKAALTGLGGFQISSEGLTEYVTGTFSSEVLLQLAGNEPNNAMTAIQIMNAIALKKGLPIEQVAGFLSQTQSELQSKGTVNSRIDINRLNERIAQQAGVLDQLIGKADQQRTTQWADKAATVSAVNQIDAFFDAKARVANNPNFLAYLDEVFDLLGEGRLEALGKEENGMLQIPSWEEYLSNPVMTAVPQSQAPALAASNPNPNLKQLASTSTSSTNNSESDGLRSSSQPIQKSGNGFGK